MNRFAYANGNPVSLIDPFGHMAQDEDSLGEMPEYGSLEWALEPGLDEAEYERRSAIVAQMAGWRAVAEFFTAFVAMKADRGGRGSSPRNVARASSSVEKSPSAFARSLQGSGNYPGVDRYKDILLKKGTIIFGGAPGQSNFYTTASAVRRSGGNADTLFQGLQVGPHPVHGYRPGVTAYRVLEDAPVAFGRALANPQHGAGRYPQIVIEGSKTKLEPLFSIPLRQP
jgi:hypothetical protein